MELARVIRFVVGNVARFALLMIAVSMATFVLVSVSPIDPVQANVGQAALVGMSEEKRAQLAAYWGADAPLWERYANWAAGVVQGDLGTSLRYNAPVADVIASRALNSLALMAVAWTASGVLGFVLGVVAGANRGRLADRLVKGYCLLLASTPTFWLGLVLLVVFSVWLGWFPFGVLGAHRGGGCGCDVGRRPASLGAAGHRAVGDGGGQHRAAHAREDHRRAGKRLRALRPRPGAFPVGCAAPHGLRNLALPAITLQFASIAEIFGGSVLVEQVFSYPGLGQAAVTAGLGGDVALLAGIAVVSAAFVFGGNLAANLIYGAVDPRIRRGKGGGAHA